MKTQTRKEREKRIAWAEEHIEQAIAEARADQQKYPGSRVRYEGTEAGLRQALFIFRLFLRPEHPDVRQAKKTNDELIDKENVA